MYSELIRAALFQPSSLQSPYPWVGHIPFVAWLVGFLRPSTIVELGTHSGNSYFSMCQAIKDHKLPTRCYAVDSWLGESHAGYYDESVYNYVQSYNSREYAAFSSLLRMDFDQALPLFDNESIDFIHIDGLHTYNAVKHDFYSWLPKLSQNAVVLFHDINVFREDFGVWKLWSELKEIYPNNFEFLHSHGLGVLHICDKASAHLGHNRLFEHGSEFQKLIVNYFEVLGSGLTARLERDVANSEIEESHKCIRLLQNKVIDNEQEIERSHAIVRQLQEIICQKQSEIKNNHITIQTLQDNIAQRN